MKLFFLLAFLVANTGAYAQSAQKTQDCGPLAATLILKLSALVELQGAESVKVMALLQKPSNAKLSLAQIKKEHLALLKESRDPIRILTNDIQKYMNDYERCTKKQISNENAKSE